MNTVLTSSPQEAAGYINQGGLVAFPTETVYGLGADITSEDALTGIFKAKGRPSDNPLIVHISSPARIGEVAATVTPEAETLMEIFFPGPLTLILPRQPWISDLVTAGRSTVGVRCPGNALTREFLSCCTHPVAAPSANISGRPSSTDWHAVQHDLQGKIDCILKGSSSAIGLESTIVDCSSPVPTLLRQGAVSLETLRDVLPSIQASTRHTPGKTPRSPGQKYPHYAPRAQVVLIDTDATKTAAVPENTAYIGMGKAPEGFRKTLQCPDLDTYAHSLFRFFRECDHEGISTIYCQRPPSSGIGRALHDRIERAAEPR